MKIIFFIFGILYSANGYGVPPGGPPPGGNPGGGPPGGGTSNNF